MPAAATTPLRLTAGPLSSKKQLANKKLTKKVHKLVKKAAGAKVLRRGVKEVIKALRKGDAAGGICVMAGDISPIDVISHMAVYCEEKEVPYVYVPSKHDLGAASATKRPTSCVLVKPKKGSDFDAQELFDEVKAELVKIAPVFK